jgi:glycosyltransferase involved in cell wall biosynthesis
MKAQNQNRPPRVLYGITKPNFGGAQRYVFDLATKLRLRNIETAVLCGSEKGAKEGKLIEKLKEERIIVVKAPGLTNSISIFADISSFFFILRTLRETRPDIFHINSSKMGGIGSLAGRIAGVEKVIFTSHGWAFNEKRGWLSKKIIKFAVWLTIILSHETICVSERVRSDVIHLPFVQSKLSVIRNGIEEFETLPRETAREKLEPGISEEALLFGAVAELHHIKGLDILLKAWADFKIEHEGELVILGEGQERIYLESMAKMLGIENSVQFLGFVDNPRYILSGLDVLVMPSRSEGLPYALLEAGMAGLPVIASNVGGIPEVIEDEVSGILVPKENPYTLLSALSLLAKDKNKRNELGQALKEKVKKDFSIQRMLDETIRIYSK